MSKPRVLILCTGNSCRSQMAEGFLRAFQGQQYEVASAGSDPKNQVHPLAIKVMAEAGIDISHHRPKPLADFLGHVPAIHLLIVCDKAGAACPRIWPGAATRDYLPFDDPSQFVGSETQTVSEFRRVRDLIGQAMKTWTPQTATASA
jgi:arsenate reductase (thioredoxin)